MRTPGELFASAAEVIVRGVEAAEAYPSRTRPRKLVALFSGGYDSICACHVASRFKDFDGVTHIDTGIGARATADFVRLACKALGWPLSVLRSPETYEKFVRLHGFPGPGGHKWTYQRLKERCVRAVSKGRVVVLVSGGRQAESTRRMGHVEPVHIGEPNSRILKGKGAALAEAIEESRAAGRNPRREKRRGKVVWVESTMENRNRVWCNPCWDWTTEDQQAYMEEHDLPRNPLKATLGMSGECFCGAFAAPGEIELIRRHAPDVAAEIDRLAVIARECGKHAVWGTRPDGKKGLEVVPTGPLCVGCDRRAWAAGVLFKEVPMSEPAEETDHV